MNLPKRPRQHVSEDISINLFKSSIPQNWVFRIKDQDYGVDGEVEIFNPKTNETTGVLFYIQLKSSDLKDSTDRSRKVTLNNSTLNYYQSLPVPVLVVKVDGDYSNYKIWAEWAQNLPRNKKGDTNRRLDKNTELTSNKLRKIERDIVGYSGLKANRKFNHCDINLCIDKSFKWSKNEELNVTANIKKNLKEYKGLKLVFNSESNSWVKVVINKDSIDIYLFGIIHSKGNYPLLKEWGNFEGKISNIIMAHIIDSFLRFGLVNTANKILKNNKSIIKGANQPLVIKLLNNYTDESDFKELLDLGVNNLNADNFLKEALKSMLLLQRSQDLDLDEDYIKELHNKLKGGKTNTEKAVAHYNIANYYRSKDELLLAIQHYNKAKNLCPEYLNAAYFCSELAGCLFERNRFKIAAKLYHLSLQRIKNKTSAIPLRFALDETYPSRKDILPLYADALMFSGEYEKSLKVFNEFLENERTDNPEWLLKTHALNMICKSLNIASQVRLEIPDEVYLSQNSDILHDALIEKDALNPLSWYNLGVAILNESPKEIDSISSCFFMAGLITRNDTASWTNVILHTILNKGTCFEVILPSILKFAFTHNGDNLLMDMFKAIDLQPHINEEKSELKNFIQSLRYGIDLDDGSKLEWA